MPDTTPSALRLGTLVLIRDSFSGAVKVVLPNSPLPEIGHWIYCLTQNMKLRVLKFEIIQSYLKKQIFICIEKNYENEQTFLDNFHITFRAYFGAYIVTISFDRSIANA